MKLRILTQFTITHEHFHSISDQQKNILRYPKKKKKKKKKKTKKKKF